MRAKLTKDHLTTHMTAPNLNWIANYSLGRARCGSTALKLDCHNET